MSPSGKYNWVAKEPKGITSQFGSVYKIFYFMLQINKQVQSKFLHSWRVNLFWRFYVIVEFNNFVVESEQCVIYTFGGLWHPRDNLFLSYSILCLLIYELYDTWLFFRWRFIRFVNFNVLTWLMPFPSIAISIVVIIVFVSSVPFSMSVVDNVYFHVFLILVIVSRHLY